LSLTPFDSSSSEILSNTFGNKELMHVSMLSSKDNNSSKIILMNKLIKLESKASNEDNSFEANNFENNKLDQTNLNAINDSKEAEN